MDGRPVFSAFLRPFCSCAGRDANSTNDEFMWVQRTEIDTQCVVQCVAAAYQSAFLFAATKHPIPIVSVAFGAAVKTASVAKCFRAENTHSTGVKHANGKAAHHSRY